MTDAAIQVLLVEDSSADALLLRTDLEDSRFGPFAITHASRLAEALPRFAQQHFDVVLLDLGLPDSQGLDTLGRMRAAAGRVPVVVLTGLANEALAVQSLQEGAQDYLIKGETAAEMMARAIRYAIERKRAAEALRQSEERFRRSFELGLIGMAITSPTRGIVEVNDEICRILGYEREELLRKSWAEMTHPDDLAADIVQFERVLSGGIDGYTLDKRWIRSDGRVIDTIISVKCLRREDRCVDYFVGLLQDVTERKASERAARMRDAELAHLSRVITVGQLATGLAHELNQPLAAILNYASVALGRIESPGGSPATAMSAIHDVMNETRRAGAIIARMRSFVRKQEQQSVRVDINELVRESIDLMQFELRDQGIRPRLELGENLPEVLVDRVQIEQVLVNLLSNALDASSNQDSAQKALTVQTAWDDEPRGVQVCILDTGCGISAENMRRLFDPFFTTKATGLGMGLNICRSIVESHGGRLTASPNRGRGMRFCFTIPLPPGDAP